MLNQKVWQQEVTQVFSAIHQTISTLRSDITFLIIVILYDAGKIC